MVQTLALPQIGAIPIGGVGGIAQMMPSYPVQGAIHNLAAQLVEVVASPGEVWVLLGRAVLNVQRLLLDGPHLFLEIV